ncbi:hypothetical protein ACEWY4_000030 [Coilia grayii]|uniref:Uncharacterized protein n=1 Tax=Coilia grayii TaxID=363190 RepID=A0ABD1KVG2_9TELE
MGKCSLFPSNMSNSDFENQMADGLMEMMVIYESPLRSAPPMEVRTRCALGIVTLFPCLRDPYSQKVSTEHFFDAQSNEGYIAWKLKNIQRELSGGDKRRRSNSSRDPSRGPESEREVTAEHQLDGEQCLEAMSLLKHSTDELQVFIKMRETFQHRQKLIHDAEMSSSVLQHFPRFLDTKGLLLQDFELLFGEGTANKLIEKWGTFLKPKILKEARNLTKTALLQSLLNSAEDSLDGQEDLIGWDGDMSTLLLLVCLLPPQASGKRSVRKVSIQEAVNHVVKFHKSCRSLQEVQAMDQRQPYILAVGTARNAIHDYYGVVDGNLIPCKAKSSIAAFDELFKAHYVFGISYDQALHNMYTFVQTTIYNIDIGLCHESPRVKELRAKIVN